MRAIIQRVKTAQVKIEGKIYSSIKKGLLIFLGIGREDKEEEVIKMVEKIVNLRIFPDERGKMNLSLKDKGGEILVVSQFTLYGNTSRGRRPSFDEAAAPPLALRLYEKFIKELERKGVSVKTGKFGAYMEVELVNDGPVTFFLDTKNW